MKFVRPLLISSTLVLTSCNHGVAVTPATLPGASFEAAARPDTLHVIPFFDFHKDGGYTPLHTPGGRRGLVGNAALMFGSAPAGGHSCAVGNGKGCGLIYKLTMGQSGYVETPLFMFDGKDGAVPYASVSPVSGGDLYGTTFFGGPYGGGTVFVLHPSGTAYTHSTIHNFGKGTDGAHPFAGVIDVDGVLYGTTISGGTHKSDSCRAKGGSPDGSCGTAYSINLTTGAERVIHNFGAGNDGASPYGGVIAPNGALYGTTVLGGGSKDCGTVYSLTPSGEEHVVYSFDGSPDGCRSYAGLLGSNGYVYGTTSEGGRGFGGNSEGTVFRVNLATGQEQVLHRFGKDARDGSHPEAALRIIGGVFYGTTARGGGSSECANGCGTIFRINATGVKYHIVAVFGGDKAGGNPSDRLLYSQGFVYGTTSTGGAHGLGTGFKLQL